MIFVELYNLQNLFAYPEYWDNGRTYCLGLLGKLHAMIPVTA